MPTSFKGVIPVEDWSGLGESIRASQNRLTDLSRERERYEEAQRQKREAEFLQSAQVNPVAILSQNLQKKQADNIQSFIQLASDEYRKSNYRPTTLQKLKIAQAKNALQSWQQNILSNQKMWQQAYDTIQKDKLKGTYDEQNFWDKTKEFNDTGNLPGDLLVPRPYGDLAKYFTDKKYTGKIIKNVTTRDNNGNYYTTQTEVPASEEEKKQHMKGDMFDDPRLQYTAVKQFSQLPNEVKKEYLDKYPNDQGNAISDWLYDNYGQYYGPKETVNKTGPVRSRGSLGLIEELGYDPEEKLTLSAGKYSPATYPALKGQGKQIPSEVDVWGGYALPAGIVTSIPAREFYDLNSGKKQQAKIGTNILLKNPEIRYVPVEVATDRMVPSKVGGTEVGKGYLDENGNLRPSYKLKAVLLTSPNETNGKAVDFTPELKKKLMVKFPKLAGEINAIPFEKQPEGQKKGINQPETVRYIANGKTYDIPPDKENAFLKQFPKAKKQ